MEYNFFIKWLYKKCTTKRYIQKKSMFVWLKIFAREKVHDYLLVKAFLEKIRGRPKECCWGAEPLSVIQWKRLVWQVSFSTFNREAAVWRDKSRRTLKTLTGSKNSDSCHLLGVARCAGLLLSSISSFRGFAALCSLMFQMI